MKQGTKARNVELSGKGAARTPIERQRIKSGLSFADWHSAWMLCENRYLQSESMKNTAYTFKDRLQSSSLTISITSAPQLQILFHMALRFICELRYQLVQVLKRNTTLWKEILVLTLMVP